MKKCIVFCAFLLSFPYIQSCDLLKDMQQSQAELRHLHHTIKKLKKSFIKPKKRDDNLLLACSEAIEKYEILAPSACEFCHQSAGIKCRFYIAQIHSYFGIE